ncbi:prion-like-(Q/N-rich) domain-bearing protein 25 [Pectinophora gossypiella]|uniref:EGF-like domain-containing protein n=1 Tax=Pectinophora gossypiella TaxID=13191 RepID=A0A1E1WE70_PECGO|nr:prion-like-(Q/N-rich) domain-bearing protein 25 [Pectinophora gossypiella]
MLRQTVILALSLGCLLQLTAVSGLWSCSTDSDCSSLAGGVCREGDCVCAAGMQSVLGGRLCADVSPYYTSPCFEDHQCFRLSFYYECRRDNGTASDEAGACGCQDGAHYFRGRCWKMVDYGEPCSRDEECMSGVRDPLSMVCDETCACAPGRYMRQRGECRVISENVGDSCVINEDCRFQNGACDILTLTCYDAGADQNSAKATNSHMNEGTPNGKSSELVKSSETANSSVGDKMAGSEMAGANMADSNMAVSNMASRQTRVECSVSSDCPEPFQCSTFGVCVCPVGYYSSADGSTCLAELGSPSTAEQCVGLFAVVVDGVCSCPVHFFFDENLIDCSRPTRRLTDSCLNDAACNTFGPAVRCTAPQLPWGLRSCECIPELAVWDANRQMCRLFVGIGEACQVDSDCLAGELEIQCVKDEEDQGYCACPENYVAMDGLCITTGLDLGDTCQVSQECTATPNSACNDAVCGCADGYTEVDGVCAPLIGSECAVNADCVIENTICVNSTGGDLTCQCGDQFVEFNEACWPRLDDQSSPCEVSAQCQPFMGSDSMCSEGQCLCTDGHHLRDGGCWPQTALFESCSRSSQCYLVEHSERVACRNSRCQCHFHYPYSEELMTCTSSASYVQISFLLLTVTFTYSFLLT